MKHLLLSLLLTTALLTPKLPFAEHQPPIPPPPLRNPHSTLRTGYAVYYSSGVMERVARNRMNPRHRGYVRGFRIRYDVHGYAADWDCSKIGQIKYASINGRRWERYQIVDCSHPRDRARHIRNGLVIEVDWRSAVRNGFHRDGRARATVRYP